MKVPKKMLAAAFLFTLFTGGVLGALVETAREITATLDPGISILYDGEARILKDAGGKTVYPILYQGTTYVPVRGISGLFGVAVDWDAETRTVVLGANEKKEVRLAPQVAEGNEYCKRITDPEALTIGGKEAGKAFQSGLLREIYNGTASSGRSTLILHDVTGKDALSFSAWSDIDAVVLILDEDAGVLASFNLGANELSEIEINIAGHDKIAFGANAQKGGMKGSVKILDPIAK